MKKLLIIILILLLPVLVRAGGVIMMGGGVPAADGPTCSLLSENFDSDADGTELTALATNPWTAEGTPTANLYEIDTAQYYGVSGGSGYISDWGAADKVYRTFTQQSTGIFTVSFRLRYVHENTNKGLAFIHLCSGAYSWASTNVVDLLIGGPAPNQNHLMFRNADGWTDIVAISASEWHLILLTFDMDNNQIDIDVDGTNYITNGTFHNNTDPLRIYLNNVADDGDPGTSYIWIDSLCITVP